MLSSLEQSILAALVYFDIFEHPLTLVEIHRYLLPVVQSDNQRQCSLNEVRLALEESPQLSKAVRFKNGYFYLRGRDGNLRTRAERYFFSAAKYRRARRVGRLLSYVPFVRLIAVCNSLGFNAARRESDIDLFIVTKPGGVWWARALSLVILKLLRLRPGPGGIKDKICLSFFVDDEHLDLSSLKIGDWDVYLVFWLATLYPLYEAGDWYQRLWQANQWLGQSLTQARPVLTHAERHFVHGPVARQMIEWLLAPFTGLVGRWQWRLFPHVIKGLVNRDSRVRVEPGVLKFHTNDRRLDYGEEFRKRFRAVSSALVKAG